MVAGDALERRVELVLAELGQGLRHPREARELPAVGGAVALPAPAPAPLVGLVRHQREVLHVVEETLPGHAARHLLHRLDAAMTSLAREPGLDVVLWHELRGL